MRIVRDLTRRNEELTQQVTELMGALGKVNAITELTAGVVHDFRNALHVILVESEALARKLRDPEELETARALISASKHAAALARDVLALARDEGPRVTLVDSVELVADFRRMIEQVVMKRVECLFDVDPLAWPVAIERQQLEAALINLSANARDAMPEGGRLRVAAHNAPLGTPLPGEVRSGDYVCFTIEDTGAGMMPAVLARATDPFFTTKEPLGGGTGLGLATARSFAKRAGGALQIESELGRGTRVQLLLPRAPRPASEPAREEGRRRQLQVMRHRIRSRQLQRLLDAWAAARRPDGIPGLREVEAIVAPHAAHAVVLAAEPDAQPALLRVVRVGDALLRAAPGALLDELQLAGPIQLRSLAAAYRRALHSSFASYEYLRYRLGRGGAGEFERLILPAGEAGEGVTHLVGVIGLSGEILEGGGANGES
jgi:nitrogen-specific signal transduction histidine kinase